MACTLGPLVEEANTAAAAAYTICEADPRGLTLTPEELRIVEKGSWCQWQPTYTVPDIGGYLPTLVTHVKDKVYEELWAELQAKITALEANAAMVYSTKLERVTGDEAMAGRLDASYAQWESGSSALASSVQTALASQNYALSQQILETKASLDGKITANSEFYQTSLASVGGIMAASGVLNSVTLADGSKVVSGFRSQASSETGSEFTIFADTFKILNRVPNSSGGYTYSQVIAPFTVQNDTVYIGKVNTSEPQITFLGEFASAPSTAGLDKNVVYKNTTDGNSYRFNGTSWVVFLTKGATGATGPAGPAGTPGSNGTRGSVHITVNGTYSSGSATSSAFQSATGLYDKVIGDWVTFNSSGGAIDYYRSGNGSDTWIQAALYVNGNLLVTGSVNSNALSSTAITSQQMYIRQSTNGLVPNGGSVMLVESTTAFNALAGVNYNTSSTGNGIQGEHKGSGVGVKGVSSSGTGVDGYTFNSSHEWGLYTANKTFSGQGFTPFTGSHIAYTQDVLKVGELVYSIDAWTVNINQALMHVAKTTTAKDKRVVGVVSYAKDTLLDNITDNPMILPEHQPYIEYMIENNFKEVNINALGEGGILVCNENGNIDNGDYLTSANLAGYAMKQDDDLMHSYTVAKALESVDWANEAETTKLIACTYHAG